MIVEELWSKSEVARAADLTAALADDDLAGALLVIDGANRAAASSCRGQISAWSDGLDVAPDSAPRQQAEALAELLAERLELRGDSEDYYHPRNSQLTCVVERRQGLPILLSCVWILVGRAAGLNVAGIGMPGHFITRVGGRDGVLVDPFHGGEVVSETVCRAIVARLGRPNIAWSDDFLEPVSVGAIAERVLNNLAGAWTRRGDLIRAYRALGLQTAARPEAASARLRQALVAKKLGARDLAAQLYDDIIDDFRGTLAAQRAALLKDDLGPPKPVN